MDLKSNGMANMTPTDEEVAPFFIDNLSYYPHLYKRYKSRRCDYHIGQDGKDATAAQQQQPSSEDDTEIWQLLGKNIAECIKQPSGQPLVPLSNLATMSAVDVANVLLSAHLLRERHSDTGVDCVLSHYRYDEMRSYVLKSDDVRDVLHRCEQQSWRTPIYNAMPHQSAPTPDRIQMPPRHWLPTQSQINPECNWQQPKPKSEPEIEAARAPQLKHSWM